MTSHEAMAPMEQELTVKKLRSSEADLRIVVRGVDSTGNVDEKEYEVFSLQFARLSKFFDTALSVEMKEKETRKVLLEGTRPYEFDLALSFVEDPVAARTMKAEDALLVVEFYDKYEFPGGLRLCDEVFFEFVSQQQNMNNLDLLVASCAAAEKYRLQKATNVGFRIIRGALADPSLNIFPFGAAMFTLDHVKQLHPMLIRHYEAWALETKFGVTKEEIESPLFPKYFVQMESKKQTRIAPERILVSGTGTHVDGAYGRYADTLFLQLGVGGGYATVIEKSPDGDWRICTADGQNPIDSLTYKGLWRCPGSGNLSLPPRGDHWVPVDVNTIREIYSNHHIDDLFDEDDEFYVSPEAQTPQVEYEELHVV